MKRLLLLLLLLASPASAAPEGVQKALAAVPRTIQVSVGRGHAFGSMRVTARPEHYGLSDWSSFDRDGDGALAEPELEPLLRFVADRETEFTSISVNEVLLPFAAWAPKRVAEPGSPQPLSGPLPLRVEGRVEVPLDGAGHRFVLYDQPAQDDGFVPVRFNLGPGLRFGPAQGGRGELRGEARLDAALTRMAPVVWGFFEPAG